MYFYKHINSLYNNKWFYIILFLLYINVDYSQDSIYKEFFFSSGEISSKGYLINNLPGGKWVSYYSNSRIKSIGYWKNALLDSSWVFYDSIGRITLKENYKENLKNGYSYEYDTSGLVIRKTFYKGGKKEGKEVIYFKGSQQVMIEKKLQKQH